MSRSYQTQLYIDPDLGTADLKLSTIDSSINVERVTVGG